MFTLPCAVNARNGAVRGSEGYVSLRVRVAPDCDPRILRRFGYFVVSPQWAGSFADAHIAQRKGKPLEKCADLLGSRLAA